MPTFTETISVVGPIVLGIMILTIFFRLNARVGESTSSVSPRRLRFRGVLDKNTFVTVHFSGKTIEEVRIIGFTDSQFAKGGLPYDWQAMVILEHRDGRRLLVPAKQVRMIEIPPSSG